MTLRLLALAIISTTLAPAPINYDFGSEKSGLDWNVINDGVMGGLSQGVASLSDDSFVFQGTVSLENNGGFSSLKSPFQPLDYSEHRGVEIRYRSTGHNVAFTLENNRAFWMPYYKVNLASSKGKWKTVTFDWDDFEAYSLGRKLGNDLDATYLSSLLRIGFITNTKKAGPFNIEVDYIKVLPPVVR